MTVLSSDFRMQLSTLDKEEVSARIRAVNEDGTFNDQMFEQFDQACDDLLEVRRLQYEEEDKLEDQAAKEFFARNTGKDATPWR